MFPFPSPMVRSSGPSKVYAPAGSGSYQVAYVQTPVSLPLSTSTVSITHAAPGYAGPMYIFLSGTTSRVGSYWAPDAQGGPGASGENAIWTYTCLGDETGFQAQQYNFNGTPTGTGTSATYVAFRIIGGVNDGKELRFGSGATSNSYGASGCPNPQSNATFSQKLSATLVAYAASRAYDSTIYYSDDTSYGPAGQASYYFNGNTYYSYTFNGTNVTMYLNTTAPSGSYSETFLRVGSTDYGRNPTRWPSEVTSGNTNSITPGAVCLVYTNNY